MFDAAGRLWSPNEGDLAKMCFWRGIQGFWGTAVVRGLLLLQAVRAFWTKKSSVEERRPQQDLKADELKWSRTALPGMDVSTVRHAVSSACFQAKSTTC